jgi:hypothetical protein
MLSILCVVRVGTLRFAHPHMGPLVKHPERGLGVIFWPPA